MGRWRGVRTGRRRNRQWVCKWEVMSGGYERQARDTCLLELSVMMYCQMDDIDNAE